MVPHPTEIETYRRAFPDFAKPMVSYGIGFAESARKHVEEYGASKVYIIASGTLSRKTNLLEELKQSLDGMVVGVRCGMTSHTLISECLEVLNEVRRLKADIIVTIGGSSVSDAAKAVTFAEANDVHTAEDMMTKLPHTMARDRPCNPTRMPYILIPTLLSGSEYTQYSGVTEDKSHVKYQLCGLEPADLVILSGRVASHTPQDLWLVSGTRAIDHCCETLCAKEKSEWWYRVGPAALRCTKELIPGLLRTMAHGADADARFQSQLALNYVQYGMRYGIFPGASHGIGHMLGPLGVQHGHTSAVLMVAVHKWNAAVNEPDQAVVRGALWEMPEAVAVFEKNGLKRESADLGDLLHVILRALGQPRTLGEVGVGEDKMEQLAKDSMDDPLVHLNPRKIERAEQVMEILRQCV